MWFKTSFWLCFVVICVYGDDRESKLVKISQGGVRGYKEPGTNVYAFYGIPYATAPTGSRRFEAPLPAPAWLQPIEATDKSIVCPQPSTHFFSLEDKKMQDDCLIVNVYAPDTGEKNLPVVVFIHGGAFQIGYGDMMPPTKFVNKNNVIGVTFNYRLGVNGFLCLGTPGAPGNAGLKDQVELLRWVRRNIVSFGGNPDDVTLAGCSAGSVSTDLLMLSKATKKLFNKVIPESGSNVGVIALQNNPLEIAKIYARSLNFTNVEDVYALEEFYKNTPVELLLKAPFMDQPNFANSFTPCVERDTKDGHVVLENDPVSIIKRGKYRKVPMLYGFADMEGLLQVGQLGSWKTKMNEKFSDFLPIDLHFINEEEKEEVAKKIKEFYFGDKPVGEDTVLEYIDYFSDISFTYPTLRAVKLHAEAGHNEIYLYEYTFTDEETPVVPFTNVRGAMHCSQTITVLDAKPILSMKEGKVTKEYEAMKNTMSELWFNFIRSGKPVPEGSLLPSWPPAGADRSPYMSLGRTVELKDSLLEKRFKFWDDLYEKYYRPPIPPPKPPARHTEL